MCKHFKTSPINLKKYHVCDECGALLNEFNRATLQFLNLQEQVEQASSSMDRYGTAGWSSDSTWTPTDLYRDQQQYYAHNYLYSWNDINTRIIRG